MYKQKVIVIISHQFAAKHQGIGSLYWRYTHLVFQGFIEHHYVPDTFIVAHMKATLEISYIFVLYICVYVYIVHIFINIYINYVKKEKILFNTHILTSQVYKRKIYKGL